MRRPKQLMSVSKGIQKKYKILRQHGTLNNESIIRRNDVRSIKTEWNLKNISENTLPETETVTESTEFLSRLENAEDPHSVPFTDISTLLLSSTMSEEWINQPSSSSPTPHPSNKYTPHKTKQNYDSRVEDKSGPHDEMDLKLQSTPVCHPSSLYFLDIPYHKIQDKFNIKHSLRKNTEGHLCSCCFQLFLSEAKFARHIPVRHAGHTLASFPPSVDVALRNESNLPLDIGLTYRYPKFVATDPFLSPGASISLFKCTKCGKRNFNALSNFHQHLMDCGKIRKTRGKKMLKTSSWDVGCKDYEEKLNGWLDSQEKKKQGSTSLDLLEEENIVQSGNSFLDAEYLSDN